MIRAYPYAHTWNSRSLHPLNTLTALGVSSNDIFYHESINTLDTPCGPLSSWASLARLNSKILMIDVDVAHALTMIHVAEDCYESSWPIPNWYRSRRFNLVNNNIKSSISVRERHPRWAVIC